MNFKYDPKCREIAEYFLQNSPGAEVDALAQLIQDTIEDYLEDFEADQS